MRVFTRLTLAALVLIPFSIAAEDKKDPIAKELTGSYTKNAGDFKLTITFLKGSTVTFEMLTDNGDGMILEGKSTVTKDKVSVETTKFTKKGNFPIEKEKGYKYSFRADIKEKAAFFTDFDGEGIDTEAKNLIEGEYAAVKK